MHPANDKPLFCNDCGKLDDIPSINSVSVFEVQAYDETGRKAWRKRIPLCYNCAEMRGEDGYDLRW
jgi:hypothetical protein